MRSSLRNRLPASQRWGKIYDVQQQAGVRFGKYRFKHTPGAPEPDQWENSLTGNHIPATMQRAVEWSANRHGIPPQSV